MSFNIAVIVPKTLLTVIVGLGSVPVEPNSKPLHCIGNLKY